MSSFHELGLGENLLKAIKELGFETPTPIQEQAIPMLLEDNTDFIGLAQTGTGKTAAFGLPLLEKTDFNSSQTQALILAPTRELCVQISNDLAKYARFISGAGIVPVYGGANISTQIRQVRKGAQIIAATPGRLIDLIDKGAVSLKNIRYVVLDEADEMLNMGFQEDIDDILSNTPDEKNVWLFSATMPSEVREISSNYMNKPKELTIGKQNSSADNLEHYYYAIHERDRYNALRRILDFTPEIFGVVFCRTKLDAQQVAENLIRDGYNADSLHGDLSQQQRDKVMARYRNRLLQVLVATDVAARGIDVRDITHVIHYHLPDEAENYTHRSGRTARAGKSGMSMALVNVRELDKIRQIERKINRKFHVGKVPDALEIGEQQLIHFVKKIHTVKVNDKAIENLLAPVQDELKDLSREELIKRMVSLEFERFLNDYRNAPNINVDIAHQGKQGGERYRSSGPRLFINVGSVDGFDRGYMLRYLCDLSGLSKADIGRIDIKPVYSFIEFENPQSLETVMNSVQGEFHKGRPVRAEISGEGSGEKKKDGKKKDWGSKDRGTKDRAGKDRGNKKGWSDNKPSRSRKTGEKSSSRGSDKSDKKKKKYSGW
ncbi:MAG: ATP-dependent helicase [Bacteroidetes bacterium]|nr:MAG: ATP-dependent helicase [Bacteroidota bacterium]REK00416.1 MAG: ATP-dependent helicase [Bacteroidota bacterium]REK05076.1 MAG: ATP-dependent helicase [Bacteroidota bacterium]REK35535.1 MAG: ATP-dependent helicase [Bacteroidota bacterium]